MKTELPPSKPCQNSQLHTSEPKQYIMDKIVTPAYPNDPLELLGERGFGSARQVPVDEIGSPIQEFFRDASVLITGGTGFMGKALTEKLLRSCPHLKRIYLLIRSKRGKPVQERLTDLTEDRLFLRLKTEVPDFRSKITAVAGDVSQPDLGLSAEDRVSLVQNVNIVIHGAATVRFDEFVRTAVHINILGVRGMLELAREMRLLKSFVHVSTAFSHCPRSDIEETFYSTPYDYKQFIAQVQDEKDEKLHEMTPKLLGNWPNTYTLTKALAEDLVKNESRGLPLSVFRPSIIVSSYKEPVRGWIDNPYGPIGMIVGVGSGVIHTTLNNNDSVLDVVPIDMVVNSILATAWYTGTSNHQSTQIYNFISSSQAAVKWGYFNDCLRNTYDCWPLKDCIWYASYTSTKYRLVYFLLNFFLHTIPGMFIDAILKIKGQPPMLTKIYDKMNRATNTLAYFALREWKWCDRNVQSLWEHLSPQDKEMFFFHMGDMDWKHYTEALALGMRVYLMKDDIDTLPVARPRYFKLRLAHNLVKYSSLAFFLFIVSLVLGLLLGTSEHRTLTFAAVVAAYFYSCWLPKSTKIDCAQI